jgi:biopolymer transport protein TolQ
LNLATLYAFLLQVADPADSELTQQIAEIPVESAIDTGLLQLIVDAGPLAQLVLLVLISFSVLKYGVVHSARKKNTLFLKAFRRVRNLAEMNAAVEQYRPAPMVAVFENGYEELARQVNKYGRIRSSESIERSMLLASNEQISRLQTNMGWLATTASATPFIGLFGTVWGVLESFRGLGEAGGATLRAVAPGIAEALIATAFGLFAAIPALIFYNYFSQQLREVRSRMEDFSLEFYNLAHQDYGEDDAAYESTREVRR